MGEWFHNFCRSFATDKLSAISETLDGIGHCGLPPFATKHPTKSSFEEFVKFHLEIFPLHVSTKPASCPNWNGRVCLQGPPIPVLHVAVWPLH